MKDKPENERGSDDEKAGERNLRYGEAFGTQRDRSSTEEGGYLEPEADPGREESTGDDDPASSEPGERDLRYGDAFGTQRDRNKSEEDGYLDPEFGSREFTPPGKDEPVNSEEEPDP